MTSIEKNAQGCQGGIHQILKIDIPNYHFQQKSVYIPNFTVMLWFYLTIRRFSTNLRTFSVILIMFESESNFEQSNKTSYG